MKCTNKRFCKWCQGIEIIIMKFFWMLLKKNREPFLWIFSWDCNWYDTRASQTYLLDNFNILSAKPITHEFFTIFLFYHQKLSKALKNSSKKFSSLTQAYEEWLEMKIKTAIKIYIHQYDVVNFSSVSHLVFLKMNKKHQNMSVHTSLDYQ